MELAGRNEGMAKYIYAVIPNGAREDFGPIGLRHSPVYPIRYRDIEALVHDCALEGEGILGQAHDAEALERLMAAHDEVVDTAWGEAGTVLPIFNAIIRADGTTSAKEKVRLWLKRRYASFKATLEKLHNKVELGVSIFWDAGLVARSIMAQDEEVRRLQAEIKGKPPRLVRLYRHQVAALATRKVEEQAVRDFAAFYKRLKPHIEAAQVKRVSRDPTDRIIVSLALLARLDRVRALGEELGRLGEERGVTVRLTGPLPPAPSPSPSPAAAVAKRSSLPEAPAAGRRSRRRRCHHRLRCQSRKGAVCGRYCSGYPVCPPLGPGRSSRRSCPWRLHLLWEGARLRR